MISALPELLLYGLHNGPEGMACGYFTKKKSKYTENDGNEKLKRELATEQKMYGVLCFENELLKQEISALKEGRV